MREGEPINLNRQRIFLKRKVNNYFLLTNKEISYVFNIRSMVFSNGIKGVGVVFFYLGVLFVWTSCSTVTTVQEPYLVSVDKAVITEKDFLSSLSADEREKYSAFKREHLNRLVMRRLLEQEAERRQQTFEQMLSDEVFSRATVSHEEVHAYYEKHRKDYRTKKHPQWEKEIGILLQNQKSSLLLRTLVDRLRTNSNVHYYLPELAFNRETGEGKLVAQ